MNSFLKPVVNKPRPPLWAELLAVPVVIVGVVVMMILDLGGVKS